jgi:putative nucleotidyltransferase with HDIG domain
VLKINQKSVGDLKQWFCSYVRTFKYGDRNFQENIILKEKHTMHVCKEILKIGKQLGLNNDELCLAEVIALFHDIGRFEQYARYQTFVDRKSEDHAQLGLDVLQRYGVLDRFDDVIKNLILRVINYHNQASLPQAETETCLFFTKLLRDADKLDIWKVVTDYYHRKDGRRNGALELDLPDTPGISDEVYQDLINRRIVNVNNIRNLNDFKLLQLGWVFDINFKPTLHSVKSRRYLDMIRDVLPKSKEIRNLYTVIQTHLDHRLRAVSEEIV